MPVGRIQYTYSYPVSFGEFIEALGELELLEKAGVVKKIKRTSGAGLPLEVGVKDAYIKMLFLDAGLLHAVNGIYFISLPLCALEGFLRKNN